MPLLSDFHSHRFFCKAIIVNLGLKFPDSLFSIDVQCLVHIYESKVIGNAEGWGCTTTIAFWRLLNFRVH